MKERQKEERKKQNKLTKKVLFDNYMRMADSLLEKITEDTSIDEGIVICDKAHNLIEKAEKLK